MEKSKKVEKLAKRQAGVLMPVSSLPSKFGIGTLGAGAYAFVDWLKLAGMKVWQVLPLLPTGYGDSPYQSCASNALNYYFIDFELLQKDGLLLEEDYNAVVWSDDERQVDYGKQFFYKKEVLINAVMGLCGESGEAIDIVKKHLHQGHELDKEKLIKELGDIAWYLAEAAYALDINLSDVLEGNINKLKARYPEGFSVSKSINREDD
jgi:4-alpha-glucanotransferase